MKKEYDLFLPWKKDSKCDVYQLIKPEFFFRLNPHWAIEKFSFSNDSFALEVTDHETKVPSSLEGTYRKEQNGQLLVSAIDCPWVSISFFTKKGSLFGSVTYTKEPSEEQEQHVVFWLRSIKEYLRMQVNTSLYSRIFLKVMDKIILPMTPSQRKICLMLTRLTVLEFAVILIIGAGYFLFMR